MAKQQGNTGLEAVRAILAAANAQAAGMGVGEESPEPQIEAASDSGAKPPRASDPETVDPDVLAWCANLDQSDTDNAHRLIAHFGADILVLAQEKARGNLFVVWAGTHWDTATGNPRALATAQRLGDRIIDEIPVLALKDWEKAAVDKAKNVAKKPENERTEADVASLAAAEAVKGALSKRKKARRDFAITSKNRARLSAMLDCVAPHIMRDPDDFNADPLRVAVRGHTLTFRRDIRKTRNPAFDDPDDSREDIPEFIDVAEPRVTARKGHRRSDLITEIIPVDYDPAAACPRFVQFMDRFQPKPEVRRLVQVAAGLGLLGITVQRLFFHYGSGANGKSVFMEVLCRIFGDIAVTLPAESFTGGSGQSGGATPDVARLYGRRFLRVQELPEGEDLREDLVKRLTGGEAIPVRDLFQGYFDFRPIFTGHMSGNGYPRITGTDEGIWRRMAVVKWPVSIPLHERREFEEVVSELYAERTGILNWLIEGALIFLREGLVIPEDVEVETQKYRDEMDPTAGFVARCIVVEGGFDVNARDLYKAYLDWCLESAAKAISETRFGKIMAKKFHREDGRVRRYLDIRLVDLPSSSTSRDYPEGYGG
ncbi:hypothetical protein Sa4125_25260 [Aureimonas sp. SA4125]|uniref:DNA primase family protein n=1 Tax=Aureimonas sp. SA4125 TaxID=2826993 RepID=UPI001CC6F394|nr:DNA primase family protein [Aureimonas sp. SA4125]BDA84984.1 hypothetical protein Sa4125_25260 [Aureimonas sp. SA4125]